MPQAYSGKSSPRKKPSPVVETDCVVGGQRGRVCVLCKKWKPLKSLLPDKRSKYGRMRWCCACRNDRVNWNAEKESQFFGCRGNREKAILRDGGCCVKCGMSRKQHRRKFGRDITVDHMDGKGRYAPMKYRNHKLSNLQTLCLSCHGKKDNRWTIGRTVNPFKREGR